MRAVTLALVLLLSAAVLSSTAFAGTLTRTVHPPKVSSSPSLVTDATPVPQGHALRALDPETEVSITLTLANPRSGQLQAFLAAVEDPESPQYHHFLTFGQYMEEYSVPSTIAQSVAAQLTSSGGTFVTIAPDRSSVTAELTATTVDHLFGVQLEVYGSAGRLPLYTAVGAASLPAGLAGLVSGVGGLSNMATAELAQEFGIDSRPGTTPRAPAPAFVYDNQTGDWFLGSDFTQAYGATELFPGPDSVSGATYPSSVAIATILGSSYNQTNQSNLPPWDPAVIDAYFNGSLGPGWPLPSLTGVPVTIGGVTPPLPGSLGGQTDDSEFETENSLDLEMAGSLAPGAALYNFYFASSLIGPTTSDGSAADYLAADLAAALSHEYAPAHLALVSCSFGLSDLNDSAWNAELVTAAATGVTIVSASGDQGNAPDSLTGRDDGQWPIWPATAATNTTGAISVGGVSIGLSGTPTSFYNGTALNLSYDANAGYLTSAATWWDTTLGDGEVGGSEGGASSVFAEPWWQLHSAAQPAIVNATVLQGASSLGRSGPDLAMVANSTIATIFANSTGVVFFTVLEGTSVAAPVLAGLLADVVAVENNRGTGPWTSLGFIDPEVYRIASYYAAFSSEEGDPFLGVTTGGNYVFFAAPGWNPTTGWGEVSAPLFLAALADRSADDYNYTGPTPGLPAKSSSGNLSIPWGWIFLIFGIGILVILAVLLLSLRSSRRKPPAHVVPWGAQMERPEYPQEYPRDRY